MAAALALAALAGGCSERSEDDGSEQASGAEEPSGGGGGAAGEGSGEDEPKEPSGPPKKLFANRFVSKVRTEPDPDAFRVGYLRGGAVVKATTAEPVSHEGCEAGWYELETGGYVCTDKSFIAFEGERLPKVRATQPDRDAKLPYTYGFIRSDRTPMFNNLPSKEQLAELEEQQKARREKLRRRRAAKKAAADGGVAPAQAGSEPPKAPEGSAGGPPDAGTAPQDAGPPTLGDLEAEEDGILRRWLMRGFHVSLDRKFDRAGRHYWRTQQNGFVPYRQVLKVKGSDFEGVVLDGEETTLPVGWAISGRARRYRPVGERGVRPARDQMEFHDSFEVAGERELRGREYFVGEDEMLYRDTYVRVARPRERPDGIGEDEKWIDVDLSKQILVAYEGDTPVFATLVSTGRVKDPDDPDKNHETPTGTYRVTAKHLTHNMDGDTAIDGPYSLDDVPYVMYFELAYAIHSAFWHNLFGRPKSHGCVNMAPKDAKWLFDWAGPELPEGWHGVYPQEEEQGTAIVIHGETPRG